MGVVTAQAEEAGEGFGVAMDNVDVGGTGGVDHFEEFWE